MPQTLCSMVVERALGLESEYRDSNSGPFTDFLHHLEYILYDAEPQMSTSEMEIMGHLSQSRF